MSTTQFDPDLWLESATRTIENYVKAEIDASIKVGAVDSGLQAYEVVMEWPDSSAMGEFIKLAKTVVHFAMDDIDNRRLGMGPARIQVTEEITPDPDIADTVTTHQAMGHRLDMDVGIWATDKSGGTTSRMRIYQTLHSIFGTDIGRMKFREETDIEVIRFNGGRFITDRINDVRVFRSIDSELIVQVFSRASEAPDVIVDGEIIQNPLLTLDEVQLT